MKFEKIRDVRSPEKANVSDSGIDFYIPYDVGYITNQYGKSISPILIKEDEVTLDTKEIFHIYPGDNVRINLGVKIELPKGYDLLFVNKSGIASKTGLILGACLVDNGYRGELILNLINTSSSVAEIYGGMKIAQGIIRNVIPLDISEVSSVNGDTDRGDGGFGSTGIN